MPALRSAGIVVALAVAVADWDGVDDNEDAPGENPDAIAPPTGAALGGGVVKNQRRPRREMTVSVSSLESKSSVSKQK